jgi:hypothetical protein
MFLLALGTIPRRCVEIVQEIIHERAAAAPGPCVRRSEAKQAREVARFLERRFNAEGAAWMREAHVHGHLWQNQEAWRRWEQQREEVDRAWDHAVELSEAAGYRYKNRTGEMVWPRVKASLFDLALCRYMRELDLSGRRGWPPPASPCRAAGHMPRRSTAAVPLLRRRAKRQRGAPKAAT